MTLLRSLAPVTVAILCVPATATANQIDDFNRARNAWDTSDYAESIRRFEPLLRTGPSALTDPLLVRDARVYYAASLIMEGRAQEAEQQFVELLRSMPDYEIDPVAYPTAVVDLFRSVRSRIADELLAQRERTERERRQRERAARERLLLEERRRRAESAVYVERVVVSRAPVFMAFPFGVGQFVNGDSGKGVAFLTIEATLLVINVSSYFVQSAIEPHEVIGVNRTIADVSFYANVISFGALLLTAAVGITEAFLSFRGQEVRWRHVPRDNVPSEFQITMERGRLGLAF